MRRQHTYGIPLLATLLIHTALGAGLYAAGLLVDARLEPDKPIEIEIIEPPPPEPEPPKPPPPPEPEPEPPKPEQPKVEPPKPQPRARVQPRVDTPPPPSDPPPPSPEPPAPGPVTSSDAPAPVIQLPDIAPGGMGPPVAVGRPTGRKVGSGGTGTSTGGGDGQPGNTGGPPPVSIASIKTPAMPINPDLDAGKLYPAEAKRLGIEGEIRVRLVVDEQGRVVQRSLLNRLGHGLDELALQLAEKLRFKPAQDTNDQPVRSVVVWKFTFVLPR